MASTATVVDGDAAAQAICNLHAEFEKAYSTDLGQAALKDLQQTFPHHWLYVGELLQNAVDAGATRIRLAEVPEGCLFEHDGAPFEAKHVRALCARGLSTKGAGTVGFMGIGFKAVFQSFERAVVSSGPWRFGFCVKEEVGEEYGERLRDWLGCVLPLPGDIGEPSPGMKCRFLLSERVAGIGSVHDDVANVLTSDLEVLALLAQRGVQEFSWNGQRWLLSTTAYRVDDEMSRLLLEALDENSGEVRQWVLFSATYQPSREAIARFLEHRQIRPRPEERDKVYAEAARRRTVDVFCPLGESGVPVPPKRGGAFALLASGVSIPLGLHVQADWLLNTSRRELMDVQTNAWHQEILARLPGLLCSYLSWVCTLPAMAEARLSDALCVLPDWAAEDGALGAFVQGVQFKDGLRAGLERVAFLPVRTSDGITFVTPQAGRLLPPALRGFDDPRYLPWVLLGDHVVSTSVLGSRTLDAVCELGLLQGIAVSELVTRWNAGLVGAWREQLGSGGAEAHLRLLRSLASLDEVPAWRDATLRCLPATDGGWIDRGCAVGVPAEWDAIPDEDPPLRSLMEPYLAPREQRLEWTFERSLRRDTSAQQYLSQLRHDGFESALRAWWDGLPEHPDDATQTLVLDVTCWVMLKQKQRPGLVMRVLCENGTLAPIDGAVLADPYAAAARRQFFANQPVISGRYLHHKPGFSDADWRSFFESASKRLNGPLRLWRTAAELSRTALQERLPEYDPPSTKSWAINTKYGPWSLYSKNYLLIDTTLPKELASALAAPTVEVARAIGAWMHEARQVFAGNHQLQIAYVPYNSSSVYPPKLAYPASWVGVVQSSAWVLAVGGGGPFVPAGVLARPDPARPDAPVADLSGELVTILEQCGIAFGSDIPQVASVERLRREGPSAAPERLLELLAVAIKDSEGSEEHRAELNAVLDSSLLPAPEDAALIDGATRIGASRLVQRSARGAELGGWLLSTQSVTANLSDDDPYARLLAMVASVRDIPENPSWEQALSFLTWVWHKRPDAELVRRILPRAYRLIAEGLSDDSREPLWTIARLHAVVYTASRKWVSVNDDHLFLDDLADDRLKGLITGLFLATPGHLGEGTDDQYRIAELLGIRRLSSRLSIVAEFANEQPVPVAWANALREIMDLLGSCAQEDDATNAPTTHPDLAYFAQIIKSLVDEGETTKSWRVYAARDGDRLCMAGDPDDFAADLCRVLLQWAGLANRRDLDELAPVVTQLIGWLDRPEKFVPRLQTVRSQRGLVPPEPPSEMPPVAPQGTKSSTHAEPPTPPTSASPPAPDVPPTAPTPATPPPTNGAGGSSPEPPPQAKGPDVAPPPASSGYTADDRERRLQSVRKRRAELEAQEKALLGVGPVPAAGDDPGDAKERSGEFRSDDAYRDAALSFERRAGRYPVAKAATQAGHDIDSFDKPLDDPERQLVRRIEVKGHGCNWTDDETVEVSDTQFRDALTKKDDGLALADEFDYWLYVVERQDDGTLKVIPIKNPAQRAAKFEFRGGTWRALAEDRDETGE